MVAICGLRNPDDNIISLFSIMGVLTFVDKFVRYAYDDVENDARV